MRDAVNLAWKLHLVTQGRAELDLLDSYERERRTHVRGTLERTLFLARRLEADSGAERLLRGLLLGAIGSLQPLKAVMRPLVSPPRLLGDGCFDPRSPLAGEHLPQVRLHAPSSLAFDGQGAAGDRDEAWTDDAIGYRGALVFARGAAAPSLRATEWARTRGIAVRRLGEDLVETEGRLGRWMSGHKADFALVRPDRLIFGAGRSQALERIQRGYDAATAGESFAA